MQRSLLIGLVVLLCLGTLAACGEPNPAAQEAYQAFVKQLRAAGASVVEDNQKPVSDFSGEVYQLTVNGGCVDIWAYATPEEASADAAHLSPDGGTFRRDNSISISDWAVPPHFYKKDRLIVLYAGSDSQLRSLLSNLLGPQFAGGVVGDDQPTSRPANYEPLLVGLPSAWRI